MSRVRADKLTNRAATGAPSLTYGAEVPVGYGITGAGGINITGVATASSFDGTATGLSGTPDIAVTNITCGILTSTGNITVGGTLTYEDVTNVDVIGVSTFAGRVNVNSSLDANEGIKVTGVGTFGGAVTAAGALTGSAGVDVSGGQLTVGSGVTIGAAGIATFSGGVDFNGGSILKEKVNIVAGKASDNTNINLSYGQVWHFTTVETANFVPNIMSNTGINTSMEIGDTISVSIATSCAAVSWAATVTVDGAAVNEQKWGGGSAPTEGGASGHDLYTHNVIKTAANTYTVLSNVTNFG